MKKKKQNDDCVCYGCMLLELAEDIYWILSENLATLPSAESRQGPIRELLLILEALPEELGHEFVHRCLHKDVLDLAVAMELEGNGLNVDRRVRIAKLAKFVADVVKTTRLPFEMDLTGRQLELFLERYSKSSEFWGFNSSIPFAGYYLVLIASGLTGLDDLVLDYEFALQSAAEELGSFGEEPCSRIVLLEKLCKEKTVRSLNLSSFTGD